MKTSIIALAALLLMSTATMAQDTQERSKRPEQKDKTEMIKKRTDDVVKKYGLNETQAKQLLSLNTKYADKLGGPRGPRPKRGNFQRPEGRQHQKIDRDSLRQQRRPMGDMKAYDDELQQIMSKEQYEAYKADRQQRMRRHGGQRPERPQRD